MANKIESGFEKADSSNLLNIDEFMVWEYIKDSEKFNSGEVRNAKVVRSARQNYADKPVGNVCLRREKSVCTVKCKMCPEHRVHAKGYTVVLVVDEEKGNIQSVNCQDCAASNGEFQKMRYGDSKAVTGNETDVEDIKDSFMFSKAYDKTDILELLIKDEHTIGITKNDQCLIKHENTQNAIEYRCSECSYKTGHLRNLKIHLKTHTKPHHCDICLKKFAKKVYLKAHIRNRHTGDENEKDYQCSECFFQTNYKHVLKNHLNRHNNTKPFQCSHCVQTFIKKDSLNVHVKNKHTKNELGKDYNCTEYSFQTNYRNNLLTHINTHKRLFRCDICTKDFTRKESLKMHMKNQHDDDDKVTNDYKCSECSYRTHYKSSLKKHLNTHKKPYECGDCTKKFAQKSNLECHIKDKHMENARAKDYKCPECFYATNCKDTLQKHINTHTKPYQCDTCMMRFAQKINLKSHIKNKHAENASAKDYQCSECIYQTNSKSNLKSHLNTHKKPYQCDTCTMKFGEKKSLKGHMRNKHAEAGSAKEYKCPQCCYQTNSNVYFQRHINTHKKPYRCDVCMVKFSTKHYLNVHVKNKHSKPGSAKDYQCSECAYQTNRNSSFKVHLNKHRKPFGCDNCAMKFSQKYILKAHMKMKH